MPETPALQRLVLIPGGGACNRLRAIASARRLCELVGARCTVVWDWGFFAQFFTPPPGVEILQKFSGVTALQVKHRPRRFNATRTVDVAVRTLELRSQYVFWGSHEPPVGLAEIMPFFPNLNERLRKIVADFAAAHLAGAVGLHLRRTDNKQAIEKSPDELFLREARALIDAGKKIYLATDNTETERLMKGHFGANIISYPKRTSLAKRWPRPFDPVATEDDLIDLFLLARTEYILGSYWSSYSGIAMALNASPQCRILRQDNMREDNTDND